MPCRHRARRIARLLLAALQPLAIHWGCWTPLPPPNLPRRGTSPLHPEELRPDLPLTPTERALNHQLRHLDR
ncbi:DUF6059 family protein [Kitasatospora sp. GAS204B]|uniref:DUF6059 family protein n=1 Tax=unclassified Kitasatospora TaxID=2633591 RepID=UPI002473C178|nr:DUF6059 family protein [Kitasatospora sp. GAS204B]MDH6118817.1 hypothetical protein [Kitasatospora sp. GAS204B]